MRLCKMCCSLLFSLLFLLTVFSGVFINASAVLANGRYMTPQESLDVFGSQIPFTYFDGTDYTSASFLYNTTVSMGTTSGALPANWSDFSAATYLEYVATVDSPVPVVNPNYITVNIQPTYSIFDTEQITSLIALSSITNSVSTVYQSPSWDWSIGGTTYHYENDLDDGSGLYSSIQFRQHFQCTFVPMQYLGSASISGYSYRAQFSGNAVGGSSVAGAYRYKYYLYVMCPYISADASGSFGTVTTTGGSGDVNVNVDVDLTETNGILSGIQNILSGIVDGVKGLFIPSQNALSTFVNAVDTLLHETFGIFYDNETLIHSSLTQLLTGSAQESIYFEGFTMSLAGTSFTFPSFNVPLKPDNAHMSLLYTSLATAIDIVCTLAFINMLKHKIWAVFMGEKIVEVEELDDAD